MLLAGMLLRGIGADLKGGLKELCWGAKSDGGETEKLSWRKKSDEKKKCLGDFLRNLET